MPKIGNIPWNKGLTRETDSRVALLSDSLIGKTKQGLVGKTYEEIYGEDKANELRELRRQNAYVLVSEGKLNGADYRRGQSAIWVAGSNNHRWCNGEYAPQVYDDNFTPELKKVVLDRDHYQCFVCDKNDHRLHIHHIDYNKMNSVESNLVTLCARCHGRTTWTGDRAYWEIFFKRNFWYLGWGFDLCLN
jgi:hypothetical protein